MNKDEVIALAEKCKLAVLIHSQWTAEIKEFTVVDYVVEGDLEDGSRDARGALGLGDGHPKAHRFRFPR